MNFEVVPPTISHKNITNQKVSLNFDEALLTTTTRITFKKGLEYTCTNYKSKLRHPHNPKMIITTRITF